MMFPLLVTKLAPLVIRTSEPEESSIVAAVVTVGRPQL